MDQNTVRLLVFVLVLVSLACAEALWPRKQRVIERKLRWPSNLGLSVINTVALKFLGPITAIAAANVAHHNNYGILTLLRSDLPFWLDIIIGFALLDLFIYLQHVLSHKVPLFWRFHKVHHADRDLDVTTGIRFHPIEVLFSMLFKCGLILLFGPLTFAVFLFEVVLNGSAMFNHANIRLPLWLDRILRKIIVTPDMHRVHHSIIQTETDSNYGFFLSIWDQACNTYSAQPQNGHDEMIIGLKEYQTNAPAKLSWSLTVPFVRKP